MNLTYQAFLYERLVFWDLREGGVGSGAMKRRKSSLAHKGLRISWVQYSLALIFTIPVLFVSLLSITIWLPWLIA
ncbi:MAG TPA: ArsB/NhaD family transporter [Candidatus Sericytochromatia bacterium]